MNTTIIIHKIYDYVYDYESLNKFRLCSKHLSMVVGKKYFLKKKIKESKINNYNKKEFRNFVNKYNLSLNIIISDVKDMYKFLTYKINSIKFVGGCYRDYIDYGWIKSIDNFKYFTPCMIETLDFSYINYTPLFKKNFYKNFPKLKKLVLNYSFNHPIKENIFPSTLETLKFGHQFNNIIKVLPASLTKLVFGNGFNQKINFLLPSKLRKLKFGDSFNNPINVLPVTLKVLILGSDFNKPIDHVLPPFLEKLICCYDFNQPLIMLPLTLKFLKLRRKFNNKLIIPESLEILELYELETNNFLKYIKLPSTLKIRYRGQSYDITRKMDKGIAVFKKKRK